MLSRLCTSIFFLIFFFDQNVVFSSPVLLWSNGIWPNENSVALSTFSPIEILSKSICQLPNEQIQLEIFAVNQLTHQQIQRGSQNQHSILADAKTDDKFRYFPDVRGDVFKSFSLVDRSNSLECSRIRFQVSSPKIFDSLTDAIDAMDVSMKSLKSETNVPVVFALITGPESSTNEIRVRREVVDSDNVLISDDGCMFHAEKLYLGSVKKNDPNSQTFTLDLDESSCSPNNVSNSTNAVVLNLVWVGEPNNTDKHEMMLHVSSNGLYWKLDQVVFNESEYRYFAYGMHSLMDTPPKFSYVCTTAKFVKYNPAKYGTYDFKYQFFITNFQFQPFNANSTRFGPPNYCTSFFTSGIWMGITSSLLCLGILLFGIRQMMTIKTNDHFDDPKGKPLIIKAQE